MVRHMLDRPMTRSEFLLLSAVAAAQAAGALSGCATRRPKEAKGKLRHGVVVHDQKVPPSTTRAFFCAGVTSYYGNGDCILLENIDQDGRRLFGLIDAGREIATRDGASTVVLDYLAGHEVDALEWLVITHQHLDHMGDAINVLKHYPVKTVYMKHYDLRFSPGDSQVIYERIIRLALERGGRVVGIPHESLDPSGGRLSTASPSLTADFIAWAKANSGLIADCEAFSESNVAFSLGTAELRLANWGEWDSEGNPWDLSSDVGHEVVDNENNNSLGVVLRHGRTVGVFGGDMNNSDAYGTAGIGDEDRLGGQIGKVDFFKLNHHGYGGSNSTSFLDILLPDHVMISNDSGRPHAPTITWLERHGVDFEYVASDPYGSIVTFSNLDVSMSVETRDKFALRGGQVYHIPLSLEEEAYPVKLVSATRVARTWDELRSLIRDNRTSYHSDSTGTITAIDALTIDVSGMGRVDATSCIEIEVGQVITITSTSDVTMVRGSRLTADPLFLVRGSLTLDGPLTLDGNRSSVPGCSASLITSVGGILAVSGATLQNNRKQATSPSIDGMRSLRACYGGAIVSYGGKTSLTGGTTIRSNETHYTADIEVDNRSHSYFSAGAGVASIGGNLIIDGATVQRNHAAIASRAWARSSLPISPTISAYASGGGIYVRGDAGCDWDDLTLVDNSVSNTSSVNGGPNKSPFTLKTIVSGSGARVRYASLGIHASVISGNAAASAADTMLGGGICLESCIASMDTCVIEGNRCDDCGAGIYATSSSVAMSDSTFLGNRASLRGGGIYIDSDARSRLRVSSCSFTANEAVGAHGGACWAYCPTTVRGCRFMENTAGHYGGAIYSNGGITVDAPTSFSGNLAAAGSDMSIGYSKTTYHRVEAAGDTFVGDHATAEPLDEAPALDVRLFPRADDETKSVVEIAATSRTGISEISVDGVAYNDPSVSLVATDGMLVVATDLAGRTTSQVVRL